MSKNLIAAVFLTQAVACNSPTPHSDSVLDHPREVSASKSIDVTAKAVATILFRDVSTHGNASQTVLETPVAKMTIRNTQISGKEPLGMTGIPKRFGEYLWYNQYEAILIRENGIVANSDAKGKTTVRISLGDLREIKFPNVYYGLEAEFPQTLRELAQKDEKLSKSVAGVRDFIIVRKTSVGKTALAYYQDEKLLLATHVSTGKMGHETPVWLFTTGSRQSYKKSRIYESAPMPYAIQVDGDIFLHHGRVNGSQLSHGCIRVPGFYQEILFREVKNHTRILVDISSSSRLTQ